MNAKQTATIRNWTMQNVGEADVLWGNVYGHPEIPDGTYVRTSAIRLISESAGICETKNTVYTLENKADHNANVQHQS